MLGEEGEWRWRPEAGSAGVEAKAGATAAGVKARAGAAVAACPPTASYSIPR